METHLVPVDAIDNDVSAGEPTIDPDGHISVPLQLGRG